MKVKSVLLYKLNRIEFCLNMRCFKTLNIIFFVLALWQLFTSCNSNQSIPLRAVKGIPSNTDEILDFNAVVFHHHIDSTKVFVAFRNEDLLYKRSETSSKLTAELRIHYNLFEGNDERKMIDSNSIYISDLSESDYPISKKILAQFKLATSMGKNYQINIHLIDLNKKIKHTYKGSINKENKFTKQNYLVLCNDSVVFKNQISASKTIKLIYPHFSKNFNVKLFKHEFGPALPPFSVNTKVNQDVEPDSSFIIEGQSTSFTLSMPNKGFYYVEADGANKNGITLLSTSENYPTITNSEEMINSTRYIMNKSEFDACKSSAERKKAIDDFWLSIGGSNERARQLIKTYYSRVADANKNFTSYKEGWKTDRGMIYIVFGAPKNYFIGKSEEIWFYGTDSDPSSLRFVFKKENDAFIENSYQLERSVFFKDAYYQAVDFWRQGNVFLNEGR